MPQQKMFKNEMAFMAIKASQATHEVEDSFDLGACSDDVDNEPSKMDSQAWNKLGLENHDFSKISKFTKKLPKIYIQFSNLPKIYPKITISVPIAPLRGANRRAFVILG